MKELQDGRNEEISNELKRSTYVERNQVLHPRRNHRRRSVKNVSDFPLHGTCSDSFAVAGVVDQSVRPRPSGLLDAVKDEDEEYIMDLCEKCLSRTEEGTTKKTKAALKQYQHQLRITGTMKNSPGVHSVAFDWIKTYKCGSTEVAGPSIGSSRKKREAWLTNDVRE